MSHKTWRIFGACITSCVLFMVPVPPAMASPFITPSEQRILTQLKLDQRLHLQHMIVQGQYAYVLATTEEQQQTVLNLRLAWCRNGKWVSAGGSQVKIPSQIRELKYSLSGRSGHRGGMHYEFSWSLYGYTTDPTVTSFRIKTKTGYLPLEGINQRYFLRILTDAEVHNFVEVQGLNSKGEVVQRDNGEAKNKPRQWSPKHSELY